MDKQVLQQLLYANVIMNMWLQTGPNIWDYSDTAIFPTVTINGNRFNGEAVQDYAIECKRKGDYANAIGGYLQLLGASKEQFGKIPTVTAFSFFKTLVCANAFDMAYSLLSTLIADFQSTNNTNKQLYVLMLTYWKNFNTFVTTAVEKNNYYVMENYAATMAGNNYYRLIRTVDEFKEEIKKIYDNYKSHYNN